jgi:hypothetical protein
MKSQEQVKSAYKLCWHCNKKFYGNFKYEFAVKTPSGEKTVYVHKQCKKDLESGRNLRIGTDGDVES